MFIRKRQINIPICLIMLIFLLSTSIAFAQGEGGGQSSPGEPGKKPLSFISITLVDGGKVQGVADLPTEPKFKLEFDKNVVNSTIWPINRNCFSLVSQDKKSIPINVTKIDDTIDFTQRQNIFVQPVSALSPGTSYYLTISQDLKAKNGYSTLGGTTSGKGITISFKTKGETPQPVTQPEQPNDKTNVQSSSEPDQPQGNPSDTSEPDSKPSNKTDEQQKPAVKAEEESNAHNSFSEEQKKLVPQDQNKPESSKNTEEKELSFNDWLTIVTVVLVSGWIVVEVFIKKKKGE